MTVRGACDAAYLHLVEMNERRAVAVWAAAIGAGAGDKVPHPAQVREQLDDMLTASAREVDPQEAELRRALGVL